MTRPTQPTSTAVSDDVLFGSEAATTPATAPASRTPRFTSWPPPSTVYPIPSCWTWAPAPGRCPAHCCPFCADWRTST